MAGALIGALRVSLSAETTAFEAGMKRAQRTAKQTASSVASSFRAAVSPTNFLKAGVTSFIGALSVGTIVAAGKAALEYAGHLGELADTLGLTTKDLQTFSYAAGQVGISQEELETGIQKLTISMGKAQVGSKAQADAFKAIGISVDQLKGKNAGDIFRLIADRLEKVTDRSQRAAVEVALFGKAGAKLDNLLSGAQGRLSDLSDAAEQLGIVLSDDQIQNADRTADKIAALQTVLKAKIAGVVADNANAIYDLANALADLAGKAARALADFARFAQYIDEHGQPVKDFFATISNPKNSIPSQIGQVLGISNPGRQLSVKLPSPTIVGRPAPRGGGSVGNFLAPSGGSKKKDHSADEAARRLYEYTQDELRAQEDILQAKKDLSADYVEQTSLEIAILDLQRAQYQTQLEEQVRQKDITKAQADKLMSLYDQQDHLKRMKVLDDEQEQRQRDVAMLEEHDLDRRRETLEKMADLAETQSERRKIELDLLELAYQEKKQALERIIRESKDGAAIEDARRDLVNLNKNHALDQQGVIANTRGPLDDYLNGIPHTAAQVNEALQSIEVQGLQGLVDALSHVGEGWKAMRDIALRAIQDILAQLIRLQLEKALFSLIGNFAGGGFSPGSSAFAQGVNVTSGLSSTLSNPYTNIQLPGFASGGSFRIGGLPGIDRNRLSLNGIPIADVSYGERISVSNDNSSSHSAGGVPQFVFNNYARMSAAEARDTGMQAAAGWNAQMAKMRMKGLG